MSDRLDHGQVRQHNLADWLELHGLDHRRCYQILEAIESKATETQPNRQEAIPPYRPLDPDETWATTLEAMRAYLPGHKGIIEDTILKSEKIAIVGSQKSRRALTLDHGPSRYPTIFYSIRSDPSDLLVAAHEFGHALQIRASGGIFVPPVMREMCAFLAEGALLSYCQDRDASRHEALFERWRADNLRYFGKLTKKLKIALANLESSYEYGWNYPIARLLAFRIAERPSQNSIWRAFKGELSIQGVLDEWGN